MSEAKLIKFIRKQIPLFRCEKGCSDCCHDLIMFSDWEWPQIKDKRIAKTLTCPYLNSENRCDIYEQRPIICRLYGTPKRANSGLACKRGLLPGNPLTEEKEAKLFSFYISLLEKNIFFNLRKTADLEKIAQEVENNEDKSQYTNFVQKLPLNQIQ